MLIGAVALLFTSVSTTPVIAGAGDFAGPYIAIQASASGVEGEGKHTDSNGAETTGKTGFLAPIVGLELGYNIPLAENLFVDFGARFSQLDGDVSAEVISTDYKGMIAEGEKLAALHPNIVVKVPMIQDEKLK